jgi:hypothetical protein
MGFLRDASSLLSSETARSSGGGGEVGRRSGGHLEGQELGHTSSRLQLAQRTENRVSARTSTRREKEAAAAAVRRKTNTRASRPPSVRLSLRLHTAAQRFQFSRPAGRQPARPACASTMSTIQTSLQPDPNKRHRHIFDKKLSDDALAAPRDNKWPFNSNKFPLATGRRGTVPVSAAAPRHH